MCKEVIFNGHPEMQIFVGVRFGDSIRDKSQLTRSASTAIAARMKALRVLMPR